MAEGPRRPPDGPGDEAARCRRALAERLHDGVLQDLVALQLKASNALRLGESSVSERRERLEELGRLAQAAIDSLDELIRELAVDAAEPRDLFAGLITVAEEFRLSTGIACVVQLDHSYLDVTSEASDVVCRAVRELLTNVRKHASATLVRITSERRRDGSIAIRVADNGIGLPRSLGERRRPIHGGGFGLWSIRHRLAELGGTLELESISGVSATLVLPKNLTRSG
jgi:two-component system, NarL family, sensor histidine kinase DegS